MWIKTATTKAIIPSSKNPMDTKYIRVVTYNEETLPTKLRDTLIL